MNIRPLFPSVLPLMAALSVACVGDGGSKDDDTAAGLTDADGDGSPADEDCDDNDAAINPSADETCDGLDNDCDGVADEDGGTAWFTDADGDGHGDPATETLSCAAPDGTVASGGDCNDDDAAVNPSADEVCDGLDNDCDAAVDDADDTLTAAGAPPYHADADGDGFGDPMMPVVACTDGAGRVTDASDCDDTDPEIQPAADEVCDAVDNDCDALVDSEDPSLTDGFSLYPDDDADGYGDAAAPLAGQCDAIAGYTLDDTDCDDTRDDSNPAADEVCGDGADNNCDGSADEGCAVCSDLRVIQYSDSFSSGATPFDEANAVLGTTAAFHQSGSTFATAYDGGAWDVLIVDVPGSSLPSEVSSRLATHIASGGFVIFSYWYLGYESATAAVLGVSTPSTFSAPLPLIVPAYVPLVVWRGLQSPRRAQGPRRPAARSGPAPRPCPPPSPTTPRTPASTAPR